ncbi:hypothetical protein ACFVGM_08605 [Kitasatospora purpeofusca]|uniref:hypothetical protein n=1 Tax=Kitasatospora purpeofusca TaxID=67352 RepID=UPI00369B3102
MLTVVLVVEGVLRAPGGDGHLETGYGLYQALAPVSQLYLLTHEFEEEELTTWLKRQRLTGHLGVLNSPAPGPAGRLDVLERVRSFRVSLVIEPDPACAAAELAAGWTTLLHTHAAYAQPRWRPDYDGTPRPWGELTAEIDRQQLLRIKDSRTTFKES